MKKILFPLLMVLGLLSCQEHKQKPVHSNTIGVKENKQTIYTDGASGYDNIHSGTLDDDGNLWFATTWKAGVFKYDGKHCTHLTTKDGLISNDVSCIYKDRTGVIWFGTDIGPCRYDGRKFTGFPLSKNGRNIGAQKADGSVLQQPITCIQDGGDNSFWFGTNEGAFQYKNNKFIPYIQNESVNGQSDRPNNRITSMVRDRNGSMWFGSWSRGGLCTYDGKDFLRIPGLNDDMIASIGEDRKGNIWIGTRNHGVCYFDGTSVIDISKNKGLAGNCVYDILEDKQGNMWFATERIAAGEDTLGGVWCYDGNQVKQFTARDGLIDNHVFCIVEDREANLWFGTRGGGLCRYDGKRFENMSTGIVKK